MIPAFAVELVVEGDGYTGFNPSFAQLEDVCLQALEQCVTAAASIPRVGTTSSKGAPEYAALTHFVSCSSVKMKPLVKARIAHDADGIAEKVYDLKSGPLGKTSVRTAMQCRQSVLLCGTAH